ncbi:arsenate reductase (glutaredoxin) [Xenophilus arseniciresistens]|uniref:Arsenate reductase n=1 Tax=Xenophilus arseniciresistens TaxID=1283306 RepID=A0AAE3N6D4_9BURK|nr:arsenate reductase (glutaredoxin) [Xenophilus arseniciresistens]MDA7416086.1 arsenate reductase (glutaredoxin) [Xenophilus arseniciresistens]
MPSATDFPITLFHNPACGTSRKTLALLQERGFEPTVVEYLKTPLDEAGLRAVIAEMGTGARALLREKEALAEELGLRDAARSDDELLAAMARHPILMNRPVVRTPLGTKLCRPQELVLDLLPAA